jgi:hypothetical protein
LFGLSQWLALGSSDFQIYDIQAFLVAKSVERRRALINKKRSILQRVRGRVIAELTSLRRAHGTLPASGDAGELLAPHAPVNQPAVDPPAVVGPFAIVVYGGAPAVEVVEEEVDPKRTRTPPKRPIIIKPPPLTLGAVAALGGPLLLEHMVLAPFLGTHDLLDLSESATWLLPYRNQLGSAKVRTRERDRVVPMLEMQQKRMELLEVSGRGSFNVLNILAALPSRGATTPFRSLSLRVSTADEKFYGLLKTWLKKGHLPEDFSYEGALTEAGEAQLVQGLVANPQLRSLTFTGLAPRRGMTLASVLEPGSMPRLENFKMGVGERSLAVEAVAEALRDCPRPALRSLEIFNADSSIGATMLGEALAAGACPNLTKFRFDVQGTISGPWRRMWRGEAALTSSTSTCSRRPMGWRALPRASSPADCPAWRACWCVGPRLVMPVS